MAHHHRSMQRVNWLELPDNILSIIANKLILAKDFIRFGAVCHPWHNNFIENRHFVPRQYPTMLMFAELDLNPHDDQTRLLFNTTDKSVLNFRAPVPHDRLICGFSHGWLVIVDDGDCEEDSLISLVNPFSPINNEIQLSPCDKGLIIKVVLSANPISNPNYVAMAIYDDGLAFLKPASDKGWTSIHIDHDYGSIGDVIYHRDQFYFVNNSGRIFTYDLNSFHPCLSLVACETIPLLGHRTYLVELSTDLLQVCAHIDIHYDEVDDPDDEDGGDYFNVAFTVFKLDPVELKWIKIDNLHGHALFVGDHHSLSLLVSDFPECMPNTINYIADYGDWTIRRIGDNGDWSHETVRLGDNGGSRQIFAFKLEDRTIDLLMSRTMISNPTWIKPTL